MQNTIAAPYSYPKGEVTLQLRDAETLAVIETIQKENVVTELGTNESHTSDADVWLGSYREPTDFFEIFISSRQLSPISTAAGPRSWFGAGSKLAGPTYVEASPPFVEMTWRFQPDANNARTIYTIFLSSERNISARKIYQGAYVSLDTPCIQGTSQVLDVTYRIQLIYEDSDFSGAGVSPDFGRGLLLKFWKGNPKAYPYRADRHWNARIPTNGTYRAPVRLNSNYAGIGYVDDQGIKYKRKFTVNRNVNDDHGQIFGMLGYGSDINNRSNDPSGSRNVAWAPFVPPDFPNKPVQPIHNHSANATEPFLDVDHLATGQGTLVVDGVGWTNPDWPKFYRVEYASSGAVGTSTYFFRRRDTVGFDGANYYPRRNEQLTWRAFATNASSSFQPDDNGFCSINGLDLSNSTNFHGLTHTTSEFHEYDSTTLVSWDALGILIQDIVYPDRVAFYDATTTPLLPVTSVSQCSHDDAGNLYVACRATGLWIISNPLNIGSPGVTITSVTNATHGVPDPGAGGAPRCYGVVAGYGGRMWAMFEGSLSYSEDNGVSWTNLDTSTTPVFNSSKFTPSNWDKCGYLVANREASTHELALVYDPDNADTWNKQLVWYTPANGGVSTDYVGSKWNIINRGYNAVKCSYRGSMWAFEYGNGNDGAKVRRVKFGTPGTEANDSLICSDSNRYGLNPFRTNVVFFYDYYGNPITHGSGDRISSNHYSSLYHITGEMICMVRESITYNRMYNSSNDTWHERLAFEQNPTGLHLALNQSIDEYHMALCTMIGPTARDTLRSTSSDISLNHRYSPMEEIVWHKYHWNGSSWAKDWFAPAVDASGNNRNADRHNFDTEDHTFTGRSMIDASAGIPTGVFTTDATFAFKLIPETKYNSFTERRTAKSQEYTQTLFEIADVTTDQSVKIVWRTIADEIQVVDNTTSTELVTIVGSTPANSSTHRVVVVISGTTIQLYIAGVSFGAPVTLSASMDMANSTGTLKATLGSAAYLWNYQRHSMIQHDFYRGVMENVQFWNVAWNATDVTTDFGNIDGVIPTYPGSLQSHYQLTEPLVETKATHSSVEPLDDGLTIAFNDGVSGTSFVATDYHTFGVVDGILKDNAISMAQEYSLYLRPTDINFSEFTDPAGNNTIPATGTQVTEIACWSHRNSGDQYQNIMSVPGEYGYYTYRSYGDDSNRNLGVSTVQRFIGDGWFEAAPGGSDDIVIIGLTDIPNRPKRFSDTLYGILTLPDGTVNIVENGATVITNAVTYTRGDVFRLERVGSTISYYKIVGGTPVLIATSSQPYSGALYGISSISGLGYSVWKARINWTQPEHTMRVGTATTQTGAYASGFFIVDTEIPDSIKINIDGTPADVVIFTPGDQAWWDNLPAPGPGQVVVVQRSGHLLFNAADVGKTVTGTVTVVNFRK